MKIQRLLALYRLPVNTSFSSVTRFNINSVSVSSRYFSVNVPQIETDLASTPQTNLGEWVSIRELFNARVHLGHREGSLDPHMTPYIWGSRLGHLIIDLDSTLKCLRRALAVTREIAARGGIILFVSSSPSCTVPVENAAREVGEFAHTRPWRQGTFTNSNMIFGAVTRLPDLVVSVGQHPALVEAAKMAIPTAAIMDTDCNPSIVTYPIPGNDDTPCAVQLYLSLFCRAIALGKQAAASHPQ